ncbi:MAG: DUF1800 family protein [Granulosicoccus sp.]
MPHLVLKQLTLAIGLIMSTLGTVYAAATPDFRLQSNQWAQLVIPANATNLSVQALFGDDFAAQSYGDSWIVYRFDASANQYVDPGFAGSLGQGDGFWMMQVSGADVVLDLPENIGLATSADSQACAESACTEVSVHSQASAAIYNMIGSAQTTMTQLEQIRLRTVSGTQCSAGCTMDDAIQDNYLSPNWWHYDASAGEYIDLAETAQIAPWQGVWIQTGPALAGNEPTILFPIVAAGIDPGAPEAARLLAQASFGATLESISAVRQLGIEAWVDDQFTRQGAPHLEYVRAYPGSHSLSGPRQHKWMMDAINGDDQLRQRVAWAYSQILVTSDLTQTLEREQHAMTNYYDILLRNAFGNYRDLLEDVTLSPIMGIYLSMLQNGQGDPEGNTRADENFAREVMQLFTIGLYELNLDGTIVQSPGGEPVLAYTQENVEEYARVFTGWSYADANNFDKAPADSFTDKYLPMLPFPGFHDLGSKNLLNGVVSPAGISAEDDLDIALDSLFNHPNVGPFFGKQLIKRLVTSNPTPGYVARVATAFNNNGSGVRGDMRAVIRAILLDPEARSGYVNVPDYGKLREPLIRWTHLWRAFNVQRGRESSNQQYNHGSPYIEAAGDFLGQGILSSPSVFNFYSPGYAPLGAIRDAGLTAPEAQIYSDANILTTTTKLVFLAHSSYQGADDNTLNRSYIDITEETALASDVNALIDRLDLLLMSGQMTSEMRAILVTHMNRLPIDEQGRSLRVRDGIALIMASPQYLVQK